MQRTMFPATRGWWSWGSRRLVKRTRVVVYLDDSGRGDDGIEIHQLFRGNLLFAATDLGKEINVLMRLEEGRLSPLVRFLLLAMRGAQRRVAWRGGIAVRPPDVIAFQLRDR
jgi:hypothetical protein